MKTSMKVFVLASGLSLAAVPHVSADGALPSVVTVEGKQLKLNGSGVRQKSIFRIKVYTIGLYLEVNSASPAQILTHDGLRQLELLLTHSAPRKRLVEEFHDGITTNAQAHLPLLAKRLERFLAALPDAKEGQRLVITYVPGQGTRLRGPGTDSGVIPGKDFADAVFGAWLGETPLDDDLKEQLAGN
ncbi:MAG: chalcone isomerase family protein [Myxococcales bacterium]